MEAPLEEKPKDVSHLFDNSDIGSEVEEKPKAKKRARSAPPVPVEALRPRKRAKKTEAKPATYAVSEDQIVEDSQVVEIEAEPMSDAERDAHEWDAKIAEAKHRDFLEGAAAYAKKESEKPVDESLRAAREAFGSTEEESFTEAERAWFKQGEDEAHVRSVAERQQIEDLRKDIATYDEGKKEVILDTQEEIDAAVKYAEGMLKSGELNMDMFDIRDYEYLLTEQARLDRERETVGYWKARKILSELKDVGKSLADYQRQLESVERERADARDAARGLPSFPARKVMARVGSGTTLHKEGSGTSIHADKKPGFFARLFGRK